MSLHARAAAILAAHPGPIPPALVPWPPGPWRVLSPGDRDRRLEALVREGTPRCSKTPPRTKDRSAREFLVPDALEPSDVDAIAEHIVGEMTASGPREHMVTR